MAERKSGPVKPPVIDLTARPAEAKPEKPAATAPETTNPAETAPKPAAAKPARAAGPASPGEPAKPAEAPPPTETIVPEAAKAAPGKPGPGPSPSVPAPRGNAWGPAGLGAVAGAVVAVAVCYGLATTGYWPRPADDAGRLEALDSAVAQAQQAATANGTALTDLGHRIDGVESNLAAKTAAAAQSLGQVQDGLAKLQAAKPPAADLAPIEAELKTLSGRVDAVAAGASSADAGALAANLATVQQSLNDLSTRLSALDGRASATDTAMAGLKSQLDQAKAAIDQAAAAPSPKAIASAMQLPLLLSALETDFAAGRPYAADLSALTAAEPEARVPASVSDAAANGLPAPEEIARQFEARMPDMLAALPGAADTSWQGQLTDWVKGALALRPAGEQQGEGPAAVLSRVEGAVGRHDFAAALKLFDALPQPARDAAGDVAAQMRALADAQDFVANLRKSALAPASGAAS